jgi:hypothetical protein
MVNFHKHSVKTLKFGAATSFADLFSFLALFSVASSLVFLHSSISFRILWNCSRSSSASLPAVWTSVDSGATFTRVTDAAPWSKRAAHAVVTQTTNNVVSLYLLTGYEESTTTFSPMNDVWVSNDLGNSWMIRGFAPFPPRGDAGVVVNSQGNIIVVGGFGTDPTGTGYSYAYRNDGHFPQA